MIGVLDIYGFEIFKVQTVVVNLYTYARDLCRSTNFKTSAFPHSKL